MLDLDGESKEGEHSENDQGREKRKFQACLMSKWSSFPG